MKNTLIFSLLLATGTSAFGQLYFGAGAAYFMPESDSSVTNLIAGTKSDPDDTVGGIANIGYKLPSNGWHFEFEFQYFEPDSRATAQASGAQAAAATGTNLGNGTYTIKNEVDNFAFLGNVYYDVLANMETNWGIYFGGGIGAVYLDQTSRVTGPGGTVSDSDNAWLFTYQALGGISYLPLDNLRFDLAYRYTVPDDKTISLYGQNVSADSYEYQSIELSATLRF